MVTQANPNVVPLCDILLVLLIIFMVISPVVQAGVDVVIPEGSGPRNDGAIVLTIEKEDMFNVNHREFTDLAVLGGYLKGLYRDRPGSTIFVQAQKDVLYRYVIKTVDVIKGAGVEKVCMMPQRSATAAY